jgi:hypothetical protein
MLMWMVGGGWWGVVGGAVVTLVCAVTELALWINFFLLVALKFGCTYFSSWWMKVSTPLNP